MSQPVTIGNATLYLGDCRDILPTLPSSRPSRRWRRMDPGGR